MSESAMATSRYVSGSAEYSTLLELISTLAKEISGDIVSVTNELVAKGLVPPSRMTSERIHRQRPLN